MTITINTTVAISSSTFLPIITSLNLNPSTPTFKDSFKASLGGLKNSS